MWNVTHGDAEINTAVQPTERVRLLLVGCGNHANIILHPALREIPEVEVVACCDLDGERARRAARGFGNVPSYTDLRQMLDAERADAALVVSFPRVHPELTIACLEAGLHVYCEKPLATNLADAERVAATVKRAGRQVMLGLNKRFNPLYERVKTVVGSPGFGGLSMLDAKYVGGHRAATTDLLTVGAVHLFDLGRFFMGDVREVFSRVCEFGPGQVAFGIVVTFASGALGVYNVNSLSMWYAGGERIELVGNKNVITVDDGRLFKWWKPGGPIQRIAPEDSEEATPGEFIETSHTHVSARERQVYFRNGFYNALVHFVKCVRLGEQMNPGVGDGIEALRIALAALEGAHSGQAVKL